MGGNDRRTQRGERTPPVPLRSGRSLADSEAGWTAGGPNEAGRCRSRFTGRPPGVGATNTTAAAASRGEAGPGRSTVSQRRRNHTQRSIALARRGPPGATDTRPARYTEAPRSPVSPAGGPAGPCRDDGSRGRNRSRCPGPSSGSSWSAATADATAPADRPACA
jgi:hypothetical protein